MSVVLYMDTYMVYVCTYIVVYNVCKCVSVYVVYIHRTWSGPVLSLYRTIGYT